MIMVRCRATAVRRLPVNRRKRSSRSAASERTPKVSTRAAANSMASGIPSSLRQMSPTLAASASASSNCYAFAAARSTNS
jgi:hypothetical protein